jgi:hypothetical protein
MIDRAVKQPEMNQKVRRDSPVEVSGKSAGPVIEASW